MTDVLTGGSRPARSTVSGTTVLDASALLIPLLGLDLHAGTTAGSDQPARFGQ